MRPIRYTAWLILLLTVSFRTVACDICGCSISSGSFTGIMPQFNKNIVGLRYSSQAYVHPNTELNMNGTSKVLDDRYNTADLWFRYYPSKRLQTFVYIPYKFNQRHETERSTFVEGIGDLSVTAFYTLFNTGDSMDKTTKLTWLAGGGVKLPTGKYQQRDINKTMLPIGLQTGTGAYALMLSNNFSIRRNAWGVNTQLNYAFNGRNELDYKLGNSFSGTLSVFYWKNIGSTKILPNIGMTMEQLGKDVQYQVVNANSGGSSYIANAGVDVYMKRWIFSVIAQKAVHQELFVSQPSNRYRFSVGVGSLF